MSFALRLSSRHGLAALALAGLLLGPGVAGQGALAFDGVALRVSGDDPVLERELRAASSTLAAVAEGRTDAQDLFAAARGDYARLLDALYARGHYSAVIRILVDGQEAAGIAPFDAPGRIGTIAIAVDPGPAFAFDRTRIAPVAAGTAFPEGLRPGATADAGTLRAAVAAGIDGWRDLGHAKARVIRQDVVADHATARLTADVALDPGPRLRFGSLRITGAERMREGRIRKIAGLPEGEVFSPAELDRSAARLRRTGIFSSVTLTEAETVTPPDRLDIGLTVVEQKLRRYSIGAEVGSIDGVSVSGYWLHRNLLGGGERLRIDGGITDIGSGVSGMDYSLGLSIERPATLTPDTTARVHVEVAHLDEADYFADVGALGLTFDHVFSERLTASLGLEYSYGQGEDPGGDFRFRNLSLPLGMTLDRRDVPNDATSGFYLQAGAKPFLGFGTTDSGLKLTFDGRAYRSLGDRVVLAGRLQGGAIGGASLLGAPRDELFFSGGGGTVRGQPYRSLGVGVARGAGPLFEIGGLYMAAASVEARAKVTGNIGAVAFFDIGTVGITGFADASSDWHSGAGIGLRYATGIGPIRLDVAAPVGGNTGQGVQVYIGLGQSF